MDFELIELLDADPAAFGGSAVVNPPRAPRPARTRPAWMVPAAIAVVSLVAATAAMTVWKPWDNDFKIRVAFPSTAPVEPTLTEQLVCSTYRRPN